MITAAQLYDHVQCSHRVFMDRFGKQATKDPISPFVQMLWDHGLIHEDLIVAGLNITANIKHVDAADRASVTRTAMLNREPLIFGGRIVSGDLIGEPDLLEWSGAGYIPGDIKSGSGFEGDEADGKFKKHYAFQLAHYVLILEQLGLSGAGRTPFIIDRSGKRIPYPLESPQGVRNTQTWWDGYTTALGEVRSVLAGAVLTNSALSAVCKLCHWHTCCKDQLIASSDLTLIAELGRAKRDAISITLPTIQAFAAVNPDTYVQKNKTVFPGIGPDSLRKFHARAQLLSSPGATPYLTTPLALPIAPKEIYFDIEADPMRGFVYLHGFVERLFGQPETSCFIPYFAGGTGPEDERNAFELAWNYISVNIQDSTIYYYSKYERTEYKKLAERYPDVCSVLNVEELFARPEMVDLYSDVVKKATEWPLYDQSIKTLAQYLNFHWRDTNPSGAASIEWYNRWLETGDPSVRQRILDYNEDDCLATGVVVDGIRQLNLKT